MVKFKHNVSVENPQHNPNREIVDKRERRIVRGEWIQHFTKLLKIIMNNMRLK
jgi:hypothetical protein